MFEKSIAILCFVSIMGLVGVRMSRGAVPLPKPSLDGRMSVERAIQQRRTIRAFKETRLPLSVFSQLLWAAQGITDVREKNRAAPSGGALYPLDIYVIVGKQGVEGLEAGIYHYLPENHSTSTINTKDLRREVAEAALGQMWMASAPVICKPYLPSLQSLR
jgi:nitroreductase